ncbi:MAG: hypothetical protein ACI89X_003363 [Planctomycetota bacterium]
MHASPTAVGQVADGCFAFDMSADGTTTSEGHITLADRPIRRLTLPSLPLLPLRTGVWLPIEVCVDHERGTFWIRMLGLLQVDDSPIDTIVVVSCLWLG